VLQRVSVWLSVLQCVVVCCSVLQRLDVYRVCGVAVCFICCSVLQCAAVRSSVLQSIAVCYSAVQCVAVSPFPRAFFTHTHTCICAIHAHTHMCTCAYTHMYMPFSCIHCKSLPQQSPLDTPSLRPPPLRNFPHAPPSLPPCSPL